MLENKNRILIVDDDELILRSLSHKMALAGFTILQARNGKKGLSIALKEHPNIIILDVLMPFVDGIKMLKKLRQDVWGNTVPIILLTNLEQQDAVLQEILQLTPIYYFSKHTLSNEELLKKVRSV